MRYTVTVRNGNIVNPLRFLTDSQNRDFIKSSNRAEFLSRVKPDSNFTVSSEKRGLEEKIKILRT